MLPFQTLGVFTQRYLLCGNIWFVSICPILDTQVIFSRHLHHTHCPCLRHQHHCFHVNLGQGKMLKSWHAGRERKRQGSLQLQFLLSSPALHMMGRVRADSTQPAITAREAALEKQTVTSKVQIRMVVPSPQYCHSVPSLLFLFAHGNRTIAKSTKAY